MMNLNNCNFFGKIYGPEQYWANQLVLLNFFQKAIIKVYICTKRRIDTHMIFYMFNNVHHSQFLKKNIFSVIIVEIRLRFFTLAKKLFVIPA